MTVNTCGVHNGESKALYRLEVLGHSGHAGQENGA